MRVWVIYLSGIILTSWSGHAWGQCPTSITYLAVGIPDEWIPMIDGDLSDWDWVPEEFVLTPEDIDPQGDQMGATIDSWDEPPPEYPSYYNGPEDLDFRIFAGWNETTNKLYVAIEIKEAQTDTLSPFYRSYADIGFFGTREGDRYSMQGRQSLLNGGWYLVYGLRWNELTKQHSDLTGTFAPSFPPVEFASNLKPYSSEGEVLSFEISFFPAVNPNDQGQVYELVEGQCINLWLSVTDEDLQEPIGELLPGEMGTITRWESDPCAAAYIQSGTLAGKVCSEFLLSTIPDHTFVQNTAWGQIKAAFR